MLTDFGHKSVCSWCPLQPPPPPLLSAEADTHSTTSPTHCSECMQPEALYRNAFTTNTQLLKLLVMCFDHGISHAHVTPRPPTYMQHRRHIFFMSKRSINVDDF